MAGLLVGLALAATLVGLGTLLRDSSEVVVVDGPPPPPPSDTNATLEAAAEQAAFVPLQDGDAGDLGDGGLGDVDMGDVDLGALDATTVSIPPSVADVVDTIRPSVVHVVTQDIRDGTQVLGINGGSGVVISTDGHIITNHHVVQNADAFEVLTADGVRLEAELVGSDALTDIAVLRADPVPKSGSDRSRQEFHPVTFGTTDGLRQGEVAIAVGYPSSIPGESTVSVGVISARNRSLAAEDSAQLIDLLQTDAEISQGSSGGGLFDASGQLIGITTLVRRTELGLAGLGFAIPVEIAHDAASDIIETGRAQHGWIGIRGHSNEDHEADLCGYADGVEVVEVTPGGPSAAAGLRSGDLIVAIDDDHVEGMDQLVRDIRLLDPGDQVTVHVCRDGALLSLPLTLGTRDTDLT